MAMPWAKSFCPFRACGAKTCETSVMSPLQKVVFGSFPHKMPFDYQMVTYEEIIKNDFFKWVQ
jgi:hypothetical protein